MVCASAMELPFMISTRCGAAEKVTLRPQFSIVIG